MNYKLFLDDERFPPENNSDPIITLIARSYYEGTEIVRTCGLPGSISFDHDLGDGKKNGHQFAMFLVNYCLDHDIKPDMDWYVHSQNPVGKENIEGLMKAFFNK